jgi:hypothetical protein
MAGTPERSIGAMGARRLPAYLRWDLGGRRAWRFSSGSGRDAVIEGHVTLRNVLGRRNVWGYAAGTADAAARALALRPFSLLTAGLDFRF